MPEVLGDPPSPRTALFWNGTAWQWALVDAAGHLQIDTVTSALPAGAATLAEQQTQTTALEWIDNLVYPLQSIATDRFIVRGEDQLFSFKESLVKRRTAIISGAGGYSDSNTPPAGEVWIVTNVVALDGTSPTTEHQYGEVKAGVTAIFHRQVEAFAVGARSIWGGLLYLDPGDPVRVWYIGGLVGDSCTVDLTGYIMTLET